MTSQYNQNQPSYYAIIPADVRYCKELEPCARLLYGEITALCSKEGYCWASNAYFADLYGVEESTAKRWIKSLHDLGFITVETKKNGMKWERKIWIKKSDAKGQKCPIEDSTEKSASTSGFQRRGKNAPFEGAKMPLYYYSAINTAASEQESPPPSTSSESSNEDEVFMKAIEKSGLNIPKKEIIRWEKKYGIRYTRATIAHCCRDRDLKKKESHTKYIQRALDEDYFQLKRDTV